MDMFLTVVVCLGVGVACGAIAANSSRRKKAGADRRNRDASTMARSHAGGGLLSSPGKEPDAIRQSPDESSGTQTKSQSRNTPCIAVKPCPGAPAKDAVIANIDSLKPLLDAVVDGTKVTKEINDAIVSVNNKELSELWVRIHGDNTLIDRVLSMWGISREFETRFKAMPHHAERYSLTDGTEIVPGDSYAVERPCWILTYEDAAGKSGKRIVYKGLARKL